MSAGSVLSYCIVLSAAVIQFVNGAAIPGQCIDVSIPVAITANNKALSSIPGALSDPASLLKALTVPALLEYALLGDVPVVGSEIFTGTYCEPSIRNAARADTLQLLVHGITYTRHYWDGTIAPANQSSYSWVDYALSQGYPTFAIDRIGNGLSSRPDPLVTLQIPYEVRATHTLIGKIRAGTTKALPRSFGTIIYAGHSYGSVLGDNLANNYPDDVDAFVLTGFSDTLLPSLPGVALVTPVPAAIFDPQRFGTLPIGYVVSSSKINRQNTFYFGPDTQYAVATTDNDFATQDTVGVGQFLTVFTDVTSATGYKGKVFVLSGNRDEAFCGLGNPALGQPNCGTGPGSRLDHTQGLFPNVAAYGYYAIPETGHCLNYHFSAQDSYKRTHNWLENEGF